MANTQLPQRRVAILCALVLVGVFYGFAKLPAPTPAERAALAANFRFERAPLPLIPGVPLRTSRNVHPSLKRIKSWIASVGAGVAIADLDGDGLANDICHTEPRTDQTIVAPVPQPGAAADRYAAFVLTPPPAGHYDPATIAPMGCLAADFNEDGLMDMLVYYWGRTPVAFLRKPAAARLAAASYLPLDIVPNGQRWFSNAGTVADLDGDGHLDILIGNYFQDGSKILDAHARGREQMHNTKSNSTNGGRKHLLLWTGASSGDTPDLQVRDAAASAFGDDSLHGWTLGTGAADLDGDGLPELYVAHDFGPDRLLHNRSQPGRPRFVPLAGSRGFRTPASFAMGSDSFKGMGIEFGDVNNDGIFDMYVSNIADQYALNESHFMWVSTGKTADMKAGTAPYEQHSESLNLSRSGWGWDTRLADFDNDGVLEAIQATGFLKGGINRWPELQALGTGNDQLMENPENWPAFREGDDVSGHNLTAFFVREPGGPFQNVNVEVGLDAPMVSRGISVADADGDGRLDFAIANQWETSYFFHNTSANAGAFIGLHLLLPVDNDTAFKTAPGHPQPGLRASPAIGAVARVVLNGGRIVMAQSDGGSGHSGKRSHDIHLGLGRGHGLPRQLPVALRWRDHHGTLRHTTVSLAPGWHTILLGSM